MTLREQLIEAGAIAMNSSSTPLARVMWRDRATRVLDAFLDTLEAKGQRVEWCERHQRSAFKMDDGYGYCAFEDKDDCRIVSKLLIDPPGDSE